MVLGRKVAESANKGTVASETLQNFLCSLLFLERKSSQKELQVKSLPRFCERTELRFPRVLGRKVAETFNKGMVASETLQSFLCPLSFLKESG